MENQPDSKPSITRARLTDPTLETAYLESSYPEYVRLLRFALILGIMIYGGFIIADRIVLERLPPELLWNRVIVCSLTGVVFLWSFLKTFRPYVRWSLFALHLFVGFGTIHLAFVDERYLASIYSVILFFSLLTRGQFLRAISANAILAVSFAYLQLQDPNFQKAAMNSLLLGAAVLVAALAAFIKETAERTAFIEKHRAEVEAIRSYSLLLNAISPASADTLLLDRDGASASARACVVFLEFSFEISDHKASTETPDINVMVSESAVKHGLSLTRTSQFSYMLLAPAGSIEGESDAARRAALFSLAIADAFNTRVLHTGKSTFHIGICLGGVRTAQVEGRHAYYDFEEGTMTVASGLMLHALSRRIQVCEATFHLLKAEFEFEESGNVHLERIGYVPAYILLGKHT